MFHDDMFLTSGIHLSFCFFYVSYLEPPVGISSVGSFPVWSGGSPITFPAL